MSISFSASEVMTLTLCHALYATAQIEGMEIPSDVVLVVRAHERFERELQYVREHGGRLNEVRTYLKMLRSAIRDSQSITDEIVSGK